MTYTSLVLSVPPIPAHRIYNNYNHVCRRGQRYGKGGGVVGGRGGSFLGLELAPCVIVLFAHFLASNYVEGMQPVYEELVVRRLYTGTVIRGCAQRSF